MAPYLSGMRGTAGRTVRLLLTFLPVLVLCIPVWVLEVEADASRVAPRIWLRGEVGLTVGYVHSVERTWVEESYSADRHGLRLVRMRWQGAGAGLPDTYDTFAGGFYVRELDVDIGNVLDYWFLPLNRIELSIRDTVVLRGPEQPSRVAVRVHRVPAVVVLLESFSSRFLSGGG